MSNILQAKLLDGKPARFLRSYGKHKFIVEVDGQEQAISRAIWKSLAFVESPVAAAAAVETAPDNGRPHHRTSTQGKAEANVSSGAFQMICINCDCVGVQLDFPEGAPSSTLIRCANCNCPRGTLGGLRHLAIPDQHNLLDVAPAPVTSFENDRRTPRQRRASDKIR